MILGDSDRAGGNQSTLDDMFRRAGVRHPDAPALVDPPNRVTFADGAPRALTFAEADRAISAMAARLRALGLHNDTVVATQLPNTVESVITLLGILRAGMIAAPLPLLWRQRDMIEALGRVGAKAIVTSTRIGACAHTEIAMQVAAELFRIRYICAFGECRDDGVVALDDVFTTTASGCGAPGGRPGNPAAHVAVVTFDAGVGGFVPIARNHVELIAGGQSVVRESGMAPDAAILSTIPLGSFAGLSLTLMPWLLSGGPLRLHHGFDADAFAAQCAKVEGGTLVLPGPALDPLTEAGKLEGPATIVALWRTPERLASATMWHGEAPLIDVSSFGEIGLLAARRDADGLPAAIPHGDFIRTKSNTLALRGPMVPMHAFPPGAERGTEPHLTADAAGFVDTGYLCRLDRDSETLTISGPPGGFAGVGFYRFRPHELEALIAGADPAATIVALPDAVLGQRLAGSAPDRDALQAELQARGVNPLIAGAFRPRKPQSASNKPRNLRSSLTPY